MHRSECPAVNGKPLHIILPLLTKLGMQGYENNAAIPSFYYFHFLSSVKARALWLTLFFSSAVSSANVLPAGSRVKQRVIAESFGAARRLKNNSGTLAAHRNRVGFAQRRTDGNHATNFAVRCSSGTSFSFWSSSMLLLPSALSPASKLFIDA